MSRGTPGQEGQGLVEYATILVFVVIAVLYTLMAVGVSMANVLYNPLVEQFDGGPLRGVVAERMGGGHANDLMVTITVSANMSVSVTDSQSGQSASTTCTETCQVTLTSVGHERGRVTVTAGADTGIAWYLPHP